MANRIIISINPRYDDQILSGNKKYEYRTKATSKDIHSLLIYETYPVKKVVAEAEVLEVLKDTPHGLWLSTHQYAGISKKDYDSYFEGKRFAYAYKLGKIKVYDCPLDIGSFGFKSAPQSFVYVR